MRLLARISHSHSTISFQPFERNTRAFLESRRVFLLCFLFQYARFDLGNVAAPQWWPCQKHPCTKMAFRCASITTSGFPGKLRAQLRYLTPIRLIILRTIISGRVPLDRTRRIISLRSWAENVSTVVRPNLGQSPDQRYRFGKVFLRLPACP